MSVSLSYRVQGVVVVVVLCVCCCLGVGEKRNGCVPDQLTVELGRFITLARSEPPNSRRCRLLFEDGRQERVFSRSPSKRSL